MKEIIIVITNLQKRHSRTRLIHRLFASTGSN